MLININIIIFNNNNLNYKSKQYQVFAFLENLKLLSHHDDINVRIDVHTFS